MLNHKLLINCQQRLDRIKDTKPIETLLTDGTLLNVAKAMNDYVNALSLGHILQKGSGTTDKAKYKLRHKRINRRWCCW